MGTRSLVILKDDDNQEICVIYRQFDGYPDGMGVDLAALLVGMKITNGITNPDAKSANGMHCLAAQIVAGLKDRVGNVYLYPAGTRDVWEEYIYEITGKPGDDEPVISVYKPTYPDGYDNPAVYELMHTDKATPFLTWCNDN